MPRSIPVAATFFSGFMLGGIPSSRNEGYRHTSLREIFSAADYEMYFVGQKELSGFEPLSSDSVCRIVVENGFCRPELVELENGVMYGSLRRAFEKYPDLVRKFYNRAADNDADTLTALSSAFMQDGVLIYVPQGVSAQQGMMIDERFSSSDAAQMCFTRTLVVLEDGARADIAHVYRSSSDTRFLIDGVRETILGRGADLGFTELNLLSEHDSAVISSYTTQESGSHTEYLLFDSGCALARYNLRTDLNGEKADAKMRGLYIATGKDHTDIAVDLRHNVPECSSNQVFKGIASQQAVGVFSGLVRVAPGAQKTDASQLSRNILLSQQARIYAEPQLEIYADDVKCSHGATVGQLDEQAVFYMRQRGISLENARKLQLEGFVGDVIDRCRFDEFCELATRMAMTEIEKLQ